MRHADAVRLLTAAGTRDGLAALIAALGFTGTSVRLTRDGVGARLRANGLEGARLTTGPGLLRALVAESAADAPIRDTAARAAHTLARAAPSSLWLLAVARRGGEIALVVWTEQRGTIRVAALVADPRRVQASDAETMCALAAAAADAGRTAGSDVLAHARWIELLGRDALPRRFYRRLEGAVRGLAASAATVRDGAECRELALLHTSRLLFLAFLESKGWLGGDHAFLRRAFDGCMARGGGFHERVLRPLFFGTLNVRWSRRAAAARAFGRVPFLNGGLFAPTPVERRHRALRFGDAELGTVIVDLLGAHRFTAREEQGAFSEAAVDPEMLGHAFECLMSAGDRRSTGAYYTPRRLVAHATREALRAALSAGAPAMAATAATLLDTGDALDAADPSVAGLRRRLVDLRVLDPACGSGAFLVHALETLATLRRRCGDPRPAAVVRRDVLTESIFGVDVNPTAVWLCELRLWLSVVVERDETDPLAVAPLPNLDHHIRVGDALAAGVAVRGSEPWCATPNTAPNAVPNATGTALASLRRRYAAASGVRKVATAAALERAERAAATRAIDRVLAARRAERAELLAAARGRDLFGGRRGSDAGERRRLTELRQACRALAARRLALGRGAALPFGFAWHFADLAARAGCDVVLGNPPWVRPHALAAAERAALRASYETCRDAAWAPGAAAARAGSGFGGQADLAAPFVERSLALVRPGGVVALLVPAKLWRALAGGGVRRLLARDACVRVVEDWSDAPSLFDAAVYPSLLVAERRAAAAGADARVTVAVHGARGPHAWALPLRDLALDATPGSPWLLVPPGVREAIGRLRATGIPLGERRMAHLLLGVKCGRNAAFLVRATRGASALAAVAGAGPDGTRRHGVVERSLLRPVVRGESLHASLHMSLHASLDPSNEQSDGEAIVWPYDDQGRLLRALPTHAARWLAPWRDALAARADARASLRGGAWWALFRTAAARHDAPRVIWADVARTLRPRVLDAGDPTVPLNSCYALRCDGPLGALDARALATLLTSDVADAWCAALAEPARGGYRRHLAWTIALLPVPRDWERARALLGAGAASPHVLAAAYGVPLAALQPLLDWARERATCAR